MCVFFPLSHGLLPHQIGSLKIVLHNFSIYITDSRYIEFDLLPMKLSKPVLQSPNNTDIDFLP